MVCSVAKEFFELINHQHNSDLVVGAGPLKARHDGSQGGCPCGSHCSLCPWIGLTQVLPELPQVMNHLIIRDRQL